MTRSFYLKFKRDLLTLYSQHEAVAIPSILNGKRLDGGFVENVLVLTKKYRLLLFFF